MDNNNNLSAVPLPSSQMTSVADSASNNFADKEVVADTTAPSQSSLSKDETIHYPAQTEKDMAIDGAALPGSSSTNDEKLESAADTKRDHIERKTDPDDDEIVYPGQVKLILISIALCLSVFLVALVRLSTSSFFVWLQSSMNWEREQRFRAQLICNRIKPSLRRLSLR